MTMPVPTNAAPATPPPSFGNPDYTPPVSGPGWRDRARGFMDRVPPNVRQARVPAPVPRFLGNRPVLLYAWLIAMILVGFDEWHANGILPRPSRFWYTSVVFGLLMIGASFDPLVPIMNAMGIGFDMVLYYQYFTGGGQFSSAPQGPGTQGGGSVNVGPLGTPISTGIGIGQPTGHIGPIGQIAQGLPNG